MDAPKVKTSEEVQRLNKEIKKETNTECKDFNIFWEKYPRKRGKIPAKKAWDSHYTKHGRFTLEVILYLLDTYMRHDWVDREPKYVPHAASWLNKQPWEDLKGAERTPRQQEQTRRLVNLQNQWQKTDMDHSEYQAKRKQIINEYKEISNEAK
jgi:hypothetical protein